MPKKIKADYSQKIKLSTTCGARALCKYCHKGPESYYYSRNNKLFKNPRFILDQFEYVKNNVDRMCKDNYLFDQPKAYDLMSFFSFEPNFKGYNPKLHRTRGTSNRTNFIEYLMCECGGTVWAFNYKSTNERKEISMRQAPRTFPRKYE